jgi:hypothetical protein
VQVYGKKSDPSRRHVWHAQPVREAGMVAVSLAKLGYENAPGYLLLREDTAVYETANARAPFVHGGNSLQERVVPVLVVKRRRGPGQSASTYVIAGAVEKPVLGVHRVRLRIQLGTAVQGSLGFTGSQTIRVTLRAIDRADVRVRLRDCSGPARLRGTELEVTVGAEWAEVFFVLEGDTDERVRVVIEHADAGEQVASCALPDFLAVAGTAPPAVRQPRSEPPPSARAQPAPHWQDAIEDESFRRVFEYIQEYRTLGEQQLIDMIGGQKARKFARQYDALVAKLPFRVSIEVHNALKVYKKDGG